MFLYYIKVQYLADTFIQSELHSAVSGNETWTLKGQLTTVPAMLYYLLYIIIQVLLSILLLLLYYYYYY